MNTKVLLLTSLATLSFVAHAQLVLPAGGYAINPAPDTLRGASGPGTGVQMPTEGANQVWDYSGITTGNPFNSTWEAPDNNPNFPNADAKRTYSPSLGPLTLVGSREYYQNDVDGVYNIGFESAANTYPIGALTGNATDELVIANTHNNYGKAYPIVEFPMNYMDAWYPQVTAQTNFNLTVAGFGLTAAPGQIVQYVSITDTVVGWGSLTIGANGMTNAPALLKKTISSQIDSVFLGGAPAPEPLLTGFGITQGSVTNFVEYRFFVYDGQTRLLPALTLFLDANGNSVQTIRYDRATYSNVSVADFSLGIEVKLYPNPAVDNFLTVELPQASNETLDIQILNMNGQVVANSKFEKGLERVTLDLQACAPGNYFVKITDRSGNLQALQNFIRL
jgi:hypothetical protein